MKFLELWWLFWYVRPVIKVARILKIKLINKLVNTQTSSFNSDSNTPVVPCSTSSFKPSLAGSPWTQKFFSDVCEAPITSLNFVNHPLSGKSFGCVWRDHSPSNVNSYFASSHALQSVGIIGSESPGSDSSSQKTLIKWPSSAYQTSRCSITVALKTTQPLPGGGAFQSIFWNEI